MGDLQYWPPVSANGGGTVRDYRPPLSQAPHPNPSVIAVESWRQAEEATRVVLRSIQPTVVSEERRRAVVDYIQRLLKGNIGSEVFPFGSVPLKTYLPDGDIDLTALGFPFMEDSLAYQVYSVLEAEQNRDTEFEVKDVQFINAEVKLVKCIVQNIVVDISFNQIGGLSTLCFLEEVDRKIGKDHLFKRSIVLIKAWCYYESRILGAHHGLISTYALETLVLYVFHLFHKSLDDPLAVLYRFLDYYSKFEWDTYCVSLHGPVSISSLPELVAKLPETNGTDLLFSEEFIKECVDRYTVHSRGIDITPQVFPQKYLNIIDPLKQSNNLGRSVSKGNFYRIRSAFAYGARKLGRILVLPADSITDEVSIFFSNTLERHGSGERPDVQYAPPSCLDSTSIESNGLNSVPSNLKSHNGNKEKGTSCTSTSCSNGTLEVEIKNINISGLEREHTTNCSADQHLDENRLHKYTKVESNGLMAGDVVSGIRLAGDARDLATIRDCDSRTADESCKTSPSEISYHAHAPHLFFHAVNGADNEITEKTNSAINAIKELPLRVPRVSDGKTCDEIEPSSRLSRYGKNSVFASGFIHGSSPSVWSSYLSEDSSFADCLTEENGHNRSPKSNNLSDLVGDYHLHFRNYMLAVESQDYILSSYFAPIHQPSAPHYQSKHTWSPLHQQSTYTPIGVNGLVHGASYSPNGYLFNPSMISGAYGTKDLPRTRGTGTYFPNTNSRSYRERQPTVRGKHQMPINSLPKSRNHVLMETSQERNLTEGEKNELSPNSQGPTFGGISRGKPAQLDVPQFSRPAFRGGSHGNGFAHPLEGKLEFGSLGPLSIGASSSEKGSNSESASSPNQGSGPAIQRQLTSTNNERPTQPYQLKDDGDFPPLIG